MILFYKWNYEFTMFSHKFKQLFKHIFWSVLIVIWIVESVELFFQVNHFPGNSHIVVKSTLARLKHKYIPIAFQLPADGTKFLKYANDNPDVMWIEKHFQHGGISIKKMNGANLMLITQICNVLSYILRVYIQHSKIRDLRVRLKYHKKTSYYCSDILIIEFWYVADIDINLQNTFLQMYVGNPYLIDGHRFDIGIYVAVTSIDPLRVYMFEGEWNLR